MNMPFQTHLQTALNQLDAIKSRIKPDLGSAAAGGDAVVESSEREYRGVRIVDDVTAGKCKIFFPSFPAPKVRTYLKKHGFTWSAADRCWQADRTEQTSYYAEKAIDKSIN
jgi:hypothetical protein